MFRFVLLVLFSVPAFSAEPLIAREFWLEQNPTIAYQLVVLDPAKIEARAVAILRSPRSKGGSELTLDQAHAITRIAGNCMPPVKLKDGSCVDVSRCIEYIEIHAVRTASKWIRMEGRNVALPHDVPVELR